MSEQSDKKKKAAVSSAVAVVTAASMMVTGAVDSPATLLQEDADGPRKASHTYMMTNDNIDTGLEEYSEDDEDDDDENEDEEEEIQKEASGLRELLKNRIMAMPMAVRVLLILPLWLIGSGITFLGSSIWGAAAPWVSKILSFALILALIFGSFVVSAKALHPEVPLKKFLNRKTIPSLLIGGILLCILDLVLTFFDIHFPIKEVLVNIGHLAVLIAALFVLTRFLKKTGQGRYQPAVKEPEAPKELPKPKKPAVVFTDATGTLQKIRFRDEE